jgi:hypothetical protein
MNKFTLLCLIVALIGVLLVAFLIFGPASAEDCVTMTCQWLTATPTWVTSTPGLPFVPTDPYPAPVTSVPGYPAPQIDGQRYDTPHLRGHRPNRHLIR